jgi:hypothetical protein
MDGSIPGAWVGPPINYLRILKQPHEMLDHTILLIAVHLGNNPGTRDVLHREQPHRRVAAQLFNDRRRGLERPVDGRP